MTPGTAQSGLAQGKCPPNIEEPPPQEHLHCACPQKVYICVHICTCMCAHMCTYSGCRCAVIPHVEGTSLCREGVHPFSFLRSL